MARLMSMTLFFSMVLSIFMLAHFYCFIRLCFYFALTGNSKRIVGIAIGLICLLTFAIRPAVRLLPLDEARPLAWLAYMWIGILFIMFVTFLIADLFTATVFLTSGQSLHDPVKRKFFKQLMGFAVLGSVGALSFTAIRTAIRPAKIREVAVNIQRLPEAFNGFHIVQLSDLHVGPIIDGNWLNHIVERTNALDPDMIAITGDLVDGSVHELGGYIKSLKNLRAKHGIFFITGNHEYYSGVAEWTAFIKDLGIRVLDNERVALTVNGQSIDLVGVQDYDSKRFPGYGADLPKALEGRDTTRPVVLLAHQPVVIHEAASYNVDFQLSGHTHGGQIRPFDYAVKLRQPYVKGLHQVPDSNTQIYVSSGTGYWGPPMRLGTYSEITSIKLYKA